MRAVDRFARRRRHEPRRLSRLGPLLAKLTNPANEEEFKALNGARRAAELIHYHWSTIFNEHVADQPVTPASCYAVVMLFLSLAERDLIYLQGSWEIPTDLTDPVGMYHGLLNGKRHSWRGHLTDTYFTLANLWEPMPMVFGLDIQQMAEEGGNDAHALAALMWKLWQKNPLYFSMIGPSQSAADFVENPVIAQIIDRIKPLPNLRTKRLNEKDELELVPAQYFWMRLNEVELGSHPLHEVKLGELVAVPLGMTDNNYANYSVEELNESFAGNYGITWMDVEHLTQVRGEQEEALALIGAFWDVSHACAEYPPLLEQIAELLHEVAAEAIAAAPTLEIKRTEGGDVYFIERPPQAGSQAPRDERAELAA